jgi:ABC-type polar amino acid transport system ATPase subunit
MEALGSADAAIPDRRRGEHDPAALVLQLDGVSKAFGTRQVLDRVSLKLAQGEVIALCGTSGSGKSTLIRIVAGLTDFDGGSCTVGGATVHAGQPYPRSLFGSVGVVFQDAHLFPHLSVIQNVALGLRKFKRLRPRIAAERARSELDRMQVLPLADRYPATLSGGERQRVAIARSLAMDPVLLLLDEPTANLDPNRVDEVCERILSLSRCGTTMILVTHAVDLARQVAGGFALLRDGRCAYSPDPVILEQLREEQGRVST